MQQSEVFDIVQKQISAIRKTKRKPIRVAVNGIEGTGKTVFAVDLTEHLLSRQFPAVHISIDGFHHPQAHRHRQGRDSARGYYEDSYDETAFTEKVLKASQDESANYVPATHDLRTDQYLHLKPVPIPDDGIIITDGSYLFKPAFRGYWDLRIYLKTDFATALERGASRDANLLGGYESAKEKYINRYHAASKIYIAADDPERLADLIIDNTDFEDLLLTKKPE